VEDVPERLGEVRFAKAEMWRNGRVIMLVPLTREAAEEMHRTRQGYVLTTRLPGRNLLVLQHYTGWSPYEPEQHWKPSYVPTREFRLSVHGSSSRSQTIFFERSDRRGIVTMHTAAVYDRIKDRSMWHASNNFEKKEKLIQNVRGGQAGYARRAMTPSDILLCEFEEPSFGDFDDLWQRVQKYLENEGFGAFT